MTAHIHAELMAQYAQDARETDHPERLWQFRITPQDEWKDYEGRGPIWDSEYQYRRKPQKKIMRAWVNLYYDGESSSHSNKSVAEAWARSSNRKVFECREITWEVEE